MYIYSKRIFIRDFDSIITSTTNINFIKSHFIQWYFTSYQSLYFMNTVVDECWSNLQVFNLLIHLNKILSCGHNLNPAQKSTFNLNFNKKHRKMVLLEIALWGFGGQHDLCTEGYNAKLHLIISHN